MLYTVNSVFVNFALMYNFSLKTDSNQGKQIHALIVLALPVSLTGCSLKSIIVNHTISCSAVAQG